MSKIVNFFILLFFLINANAVSVTAKKKYPYPLLTSDYDILDENDLGAFTWGFKQRPFTTNGPSGQYNYWQCFPREQVTVSLKDIGYSSSELGRKNNIAYLAISVWANHQIHNYEMRANWNIDDSQKRFNKWLGLMKGEKFVCLAGEFVILKRVASNGQVTKEYEWTFEKLKTKKGCDSYFSSCYPTYKV